MHAKIFRNSPKRMIFRLFSTSFLLVRTSPQQDNARGIVGSNLSGWRTAVS
jgi:hypothetical protein